MSSFNLIPALPFWILGAPLIYAVLSWMRMPRHGDLAPTDRRRDVAP